MKLSSLPRVRLASLPTPLQELPNLTKLLKGPRIWVKRDDLTGLAFGGNKTRKLEYLMADALRQGADYIVTGAGFHSNWCTQTAAAARKLGLGCVLIKSGPRDGYDPEEYDGNHLLHVLMGAGVKVARPENVKRVTDEAMEQLRDEGHRPYYIPVGGSIPLGAAGYMNAVLELTFQAVDRGVELDYLVHATGSGGTQAGLLMGVKAFNPGLRVMGAAVGWTTRDDQTAKVMKIIEDARLTLGMGFNVEEDDFVVETGYAGGGYGFMTEAKAEAVELLAETEGLFIDPVYTATAMACLIDKCREGFFKPGQNVVFLHTGGAVALFPYKAPLKAHAKGDKMPWAVPGWSPQAI